MPVKRFDRFISELRVVLTSGLPGSIAHDGMAPAHRNDLIRKSNGISMARQSSVLILLFPDKSGNVSTAFIKRGEYEGVHSGQIAFPGGKFEVTDANLTETALREAEEEVGIKKDQVEIIGSLSDLFVPPSNFIIRPFIAQAAEIPGFTADIHEVAEIFTVPLRFFTESNARGEYSIPYLNGTFVTVPGFRYEKHLIWGATAMILNELIQLVTSTNLMSDI